MDKGSPRPPAPASDDDDIGRRYLGLVRQKCDLDRPPLPRSVGIVIKDALRLVVDKVVIPVAGLAADLEVLAAQSPGLADLLEDGILQMDGVVSGIKVGDPVQIGGLAGFGIEDERIAA